jgi:hypothetical protein
MDMVGHDRISAEFIMTEQHATSQRCSHQARDGVLSQIREPTACCIEIPIHPDESGARRELAGRRIQGLWETAVKMPRQEEPLSIRMVMRQTATELLHVNR